jgi:PAS domain S-box-containing protein
LLLLMPAHPPETTGTPPVESSRTPVQHHFHLASGILAALVALAGITVLVGWAAEIPALRNLLPGFVPMKANTAVALLLAGLALWIHQSAVRAAWRETAVRLLSGASGVIGVLTLVEHMTGISFGIDQLLFTDVLDTGDMGAPGRMAVSTAASLVFINAAIIVAESTHLDSAARLLAGGALGLSLVSAVGYFFGADIFTGLAAYASMAAHTSWAVLALCLGFYFARPDEGLMTIVANDGPAGFVVRRLMPAVFILPVVLGWLTWQGELAGWYDSAFAMTLFVSSAIGALGFIVWLSGHLLERLEDSRIVAERERKQSEERLRRAVEDAPVPMIIYDDDDHILHMSRGWTQYSGYTIEEVPTISQWIARAQTSNRKEVEGSIQRMYLATGTVQGRESPVRTKDGEQRIWEFSTTPLGRMGVSQTGAGRLTFLAMAVDITKRRKAEAELRSLNDTLEQRIAERTEEITRANEAQRRQSSQLKEQAALLDISSDAILVRDLYGTIVYWSAGATKMFGWPPEVALGAHAHQLLQTRFPRPIDEIEKEATASGHWEGEVEQVRQGGTKIAVESRWSLTRNERGTPQGFLEVHRDITDRQMAEEQIRESELRFRAVAETANEGIVTADSAGIIRYWNPGAARMFGLAEAEAIGQPLTVIMPKRFHEAHHAGFRRFIDTGESQLIGHTVEVAGIRTDGVEFPLEVSLSTWETANGRFVSGILRDITDRKLAEEALQTKNEELARSNQELEQFAYVASHDLQEPLRMVSNYTQMLARRYSDKLDADAHEFIGYAVDGAKRMQALIHDLLQFARVGTRGKEFKPTPLREVVDEAIANLTGAIEESGARITVAALPTATCDGGQLVQVFQNLIGNAIKFRQPDRPALIEVAGEEVPGGWLLSVSDNGIGIDPKYFDRIFQMFQRLHGRGEYSGTGIGLALCKKIVERHGGRVSVDSQPGQGATFVIALPHTPPRVT